MRQNVQFEGETKDGTKTPKQVADIIFTPALPRVSSLTLELKNILGTITRRKTRSFAKRKPAPLSFELVPPPNDLVYQRSKKINRQSADCTDVDAAILATRESDEHYATEDEDEDTYSDIIYIRHRLTLVPCESIGEIPSDVDECSSVGSIATEPLFDTDEAAEEYEHSGQSAATSLESLWLQVERHAEEPLPRQDRVVLPTPIPRPRTAKVNACHPTWRHAWHGGPITVATRATPNQEKRYGMHITEEALRTSGYF